MPHHLVSKLVYFVTRIRGPHVTLLIRWFVRYFGVAMHEAEEPDISYYDTFNEFFIREIDLSMRPVAPGNNTLACPCDGTISQAGAIRAGAILQAKGRAHSVLELLGGKKELASQFTNGRFVTIYLAPHNYHRVHMPLDANLVRMIHVPGKLFSVSDWMLQQVPRVFARNERLACEFQTAFGPMALVMVGAMNVSAIETNWTGLIGRANKVNEFDFTHTKKITQKGLEMGRFNMGSTVILLFNDKMKLLPHIKPGQVVKMGQLIGHFPK
jgi:phosphatidylserine decarboxylase